MTGHRWSGWPGAWCLDCGVEDGNELDLAGPAEGVHHRYSDKPHLAENCTGCSRGDCTAPDAHNFDPYERARQARLDSEPLP